MAAEHTKTLVLSDLIITRFGWFCYTWGLLSIFGSVVIPYHADIIYIFSSR